MFSEMLQSLLNSGGQVRAMQRYTQMNNYVNSLNGQQAIVRNNNMAGNVPLPAKDSVQSFDNVLKTTAQSQFGMLIKNKAAEKVNASLYTSAIPAGVQINKRPTKTEIIGIINEVSNKVNDLSVRLDEYIHQLDEATNNRVTITADGLDSLADDVAQHQEAILALQSAQSK